MKTDNIIIIGLAGLTALALLSKKTIASPQPIYPASSCDDFDSNGGI